MDRALDVDDIARELELTIIRFLIDLSLLPFDDYMSSLKRAFEAGLGHKLMAGRPYDELAEIVLPDRFASTDRRRYRPPISDGAPPPAEHPALDWQSGPGPGFSEGKAAEMAANRYDIVTSLLPNTLAALAAAPGFQQVAAVLRAEGWLDWHILTAVYNIVGNYRLEQAGLNTAESLRTADGRRESDRLFRTSAIDQGDAIPLEILNEEAIRNGRIMALPSLLVNWGLELRQRTPDSPAIEQLLASRYGYWSIDADHTDPFGTQVAAA